MPSSELPSTGIDAAQIFLDAIAQRLAGQGFSIQRGVTAGPYNFDTLASRVDNPKGPYVPIPWSTLIAVSRLDVPDAQSARAFSSFVSKYALDNRSYFGGYKMDLKTIAVMVSSTFSDETKNWVSEAPPEGSTIKDRFEFPVLLELSTRQIVYFKKTPFRAGLLYRQLRKLSDVWFSFQT